ncbi:hypothetical protein BZA77DRAFT_125095 [Pyronema omphalodes]|nr:hypothetical protein BZA77DRAFT_125095 [Pyronema omphalodes]
MADLPCLFTGSSAGRLAVPDAELLPMYAIILGLVYFVMVLETVEGKGGTEIPRLCGIVAFVSFTGRPGRGAELMPLDHLSYILKYSDCLYTYTGHCCCNGFRDVHRENGLLCCPGQGVTSQTLITDALNAPSCPRLLPRACCASATLLRLRHRDKLTARIIHCRTLPAFLLPLCSAGRSVQFRFA